MEHGTVRGEILKDVSMKRYTSMRVGGTASFLVYPRDEEDVATAIRWLRREGLPARFLGNGTNVVVADRGIPAGLIRVTRMRHCRSVATEGGALVEASGGLSLKTLIQECCRRGFSGLEKLYGIPGTVGGALKMNAGSFGVSVTDHLKDVRLIAGDGSIRTLTKDEMRFGYRMSWRVQGQS